MFAALLCAPTMHADWSFVMLGDTSGVKNSTVTGISLELNTIAQKIATLNPDLLMVAGDLWKSRRNRPLGSCVADPDEIALRKTMVSGGLCVAETVVAAT